MTKPQIDWIDLEFTLWIESMDWVHGLSSWIESMNWTYGLILWIDLSIYIKSVTKLQSSCERNVKSNAKKMQKILKDAKKPTIAGIMSQHS